MIKQVEILLIGYQSLGPNLERLWYHSDTSNKVAFYYSRRRNIGSFFYFFSKWLLEMVTRNGYSKWFSRNLMVTPTYTNNGLTQNYYKYQCAALANSSNIPYKKSWKPWTTHVLFFLKSPCNKIAIRQSFTRKHPRILVPPTQLQIFIKISKTEFPENQVINHEIQNFSLIQNLYLVKKNFYRTKIGSSEFSLLIMYVTIKVMFY